MTDNDGGAVAITHTGTGGTARREVVRMLEFDGSPRRFGDPVARDAWSFRVEPGQVFGFVGSNGADKTTTILFALAVLVALLPISARTYRGGVLRTGGKVSFREAWTSS